MVYPGSRAYRVAKQGANRLKSIAGILQALVISNPQADYLYKHLLLLQLIADMTCVILIGLG